jgi:hypothetical protein
LTDLPTKVKYQECSARARFEGLPCLQESWAGMPRLWRCLVTYMTLVAFLASNSAGFLHAPCSVAASGKHPENVRGEEIVPACKHCRARQARQVTRAADPLSLAQHAENNAPCPSCPGQDKPCPSCPCPGGCMFCSVAKVPCHLSFTPILVPSALVLCGLAPVTPVHSALLPGGMYRPPRS